MPKCEVCGKPRNKKHKRFCSMRCKGKWQSENLKGANNPFYGRHHTVKTRKKISSFNTTHFTGERNPNWRGGKYKKCEVCGKKFWVIPASATRAKTCSVRCRAKWQTGRSLKLTLMEHERRRNRIRGRNNPIYSTCSKRYYIKELGHYVRSTWEEKIGLLLKINGISYSYESRTFELSNGTYTPDFIVGDNVIEVKGPLYDSQKKKYREFNELHPELNFIMVGKGSEELCDIHIPWGERERLIEVLS